MSTHRRPHGPRHDTHGRLQPRNPHEHPANRNGLPADIQGILGDYLQSAVELVCPGKDEGDCQNRGITLVTGGSPDAPRIEVRADCPLAPHCPMIEDPLLGQQAAEIAIGKMVDEGHFGPGGFPGIVL